MRWMTWRAISARPCEAGEQLLISYGPVVGSSTVAARQSGLDASHGFLCQCSGCRDPKAAVRVGASEKCMIE